MSTITQRAQQAAVPGLDCYPAARMTVEQYEELVASGVFTSRDKFQLVNGLLVAKMPKNPPHSTAKRRCAKALEGVIPTPGWHVRQEDPVRLPPLNEPEPDVCVVRGIDADYENRHPGSADVGLLVEVADTTLTDDRKMWLNYRAAGISVYWIVNIRGRQIEVYTPTGKTRKFRSGGAVPVELDGAVIGHIAVSDVLP